MTHELGVNGTDLVGHDEHRTDGAEPATSHAAPAPTSQTIIEMVIVWDVKITWGVDHDHDLLGIEAVYMLPLCTGLEVLDLDPLQAWNTGRIAGSCTRSS
ncbi:hypothetical protein [Streptomyces xanthochromogenes]